MGMRLRRGLSIVLIAAVLFVNFGSSSVAYASEINTAGEEQTTETSEKAIAESGEGSQQSDGLTESTKGDEDVNSVESGEADVKNADEEKQEVDVVDDQNTAETEGNDKSDDNDAIIEEADGKDADAESGIAEETGSEDAEADADTDADADAKDATVEENAGEDASLETAETVETPAEGESAPEGSEITEDADQKQETDKKEAAKASTDELGINGRGGLVIQKQIQGIPEGNYKTKFKIRLWTDEAPISGFTIETAGGNYVTDENGEFTYEMTITVNGTQGTNRIGFTVPAPCKYSVEEVECDSPLAVSTEKTADTGTTVVGQGTTTYWYSKRGRLELTAKTAYFDTDYPQFMPSLQHEIDLTYNGQPVSGTFLASGPVDSVTFVNGKATVNVKMARVSDADAEKLIIYGIPYESNVVVNLTDPMRGYFPETSVRTVQGTIYTVFTADCYAGPYGSSYMSGDQYFYYYDSTGKVDKVKFYFKNRHDNPVYPFADTRMSHTYLDDGTKVYYFDPDGDEHEIVVGSGEKVVCACFPCYSTDNIGTRYLPVDNVRMNRLFQSGFTNEAGERDESDSWSGSYTKRGLACFSMEAYTMETVHKTDRKGVPVDCKFCITNSTANDKKKYSLIHHDSYEYGGETYSNVYEIDLEGELKAFDSEDKSTFITPDKNGYFHILYPRGIKSSFGRADIVDADNGGMRGGYLYELESDDDHYIGQNYWELASNTYSNYLDYEHNVTYDGRSFNTRAKLNVSGIDPATFDYNKLDLGELENPVFTHEMEMINGSYPYIEKQIAGDGYSYDPNPDQKFTFDVYYENELVKTFELAAGESYHLSPSNIPTISQNTLNKHIIKERGTDGWTDERARSSNRWVHRDGGYYFGASYNTQTEQDLVIVNSRESKELTIQKSVLDAASDKEVTTRFKVTLWDENEDGSKAPIKNFTTTVGEETITGDENGEFFIDIVTKGTESASKTIKVPAYCHYKIEEVSCSLKGAKEVSKTNEQGVMEADTEAVWKNALLNSLSVSKVDIADGEELEGAHIQILDSKGNVVEEWDSTKEAHVVEGLLKVGEEYTLKETVAPDGYTITAETTFTIDETGKVTSTGTTTKDKDGNTVLLVEDTKTSVHVSKVDIADGKELEGAHIQILDSKGKVVEEWDSTKEAHVVEGLKVGEKYKLKETVAPDGYTITAETTFTIDETGKVTSTGTTTKDKDGNTVLLVEDAKTSVHVSKVDIADGKELEGAHIQILDSKGNVVEEWDSTKEAHVVEGLKVGEEYTLKETVAPEGYLITSDTTFTIDETGKVTSTGTTTKDKNGNTVLLVEDAKASVRVSKVDIADGKELEGAHIQILDSKGNVVEEWDSTKEAHVVEGLKVGEKYTLRETVAPEGYLITSDTTFTIDETGKVTSTGTTTKDKDGNTVLLVEDAREGETGIVLGGEKVLQGGTLKADQFTFVLKDENGKTVSEVKNDADGNITFARLAYKLTDLDGEKEKVFTYKVSEVKGSDANITYDENVITVKVTVTDNGDGTITAAADKNKSGIKFVNKVKEKKSKKTSTTNKKAGGRTGDEAPLGILFGGLGLGAVGLIAMIMIRRKRNSEM